MKQYLFPSRYPKPLVNTQKVSMMFAVTLFLNYTDQIDMSNCSNCTKFGKNHRINAYALLSSYPMKVLLLKFKLGHKEVFLTLNK